MKQRPITRKRFQFGAFGSALLFFLCAGILGFSQIESRRLLSSISLSIGFVILTVGALGAAPQKPRFSLSEIMIIVTVVAATLAAGRTLGLPNYCSVACAAIGLFAFIFLVLIRPPT